MNKNIKEKYFSGRYTYTPLFPELEKVIGTAKAKIIGNLLYKLCTLGGKHKYNGKEYQFYRQKKYIAEEELNMDYSNFNKQINDLEQREYLTTFPARIGDKRNPQINSDKGFNTTCFSLNLDTIDKVFEEGGKLLGKREKEYKKPNNTILNLNNNTQPHPTVEKWLNEISKAYKQLMNLEITEIEYKEIYNKIKTSFQRNGMVLPRMFNLK